MSRAIKIIVPSEAARAVQAGELQLVDIRLAPDAATKPLAGAVNIPFPCLERSAQRPPMIFRHADLTCPRG